WSFDAGSNYYTDGSSAAVTITPVDAAVVVSGYAGGTYTGGGHTQTVTVSGVPSDGTLYSTSLSGTNAGPYSQGWSFSNDNYNAIDESGTLAFSIGQATAVIVVNGYSTPYDGGYHGLSG